jgi:ribonucleoside-diphosphate reductase alpha chain
MTRNPGDRFAKSIVDYIFRWMASKFLSAEAQFHAGVNGRELEETHAGPPQDAAPVTQGGAATAATPGLSFRPAPSNAPTPFSTIQNQEDAPPCSTCGAIMIRSGACYKCMNCGNTSGCAHTTSASRAENREHRKSAERGS